MLAPGLLIDRYELVCHIGDGGMAHVWAARQRGPHGFEKLVALKIIHSRYAEDDTFRRMFLDEAQIVSSIHHRNVAHVFDLGETTSLLYLVMEYVDGDSLFSLIAPQNKVPVPIALRIAAEACAGLHAVHGLVDERGRSRNVVHRDVSPQNVLLGSNGDVKLIDFGIAHARDRAAGTTDVNDVKGKVRYMAPEQARREPLGPFTDVFGIGATLFRMISGRAPYAAEDDVSTMKALLDRAPPLHRLPSDVPSRVADVIHRAIAVDSADRFKTAEQLGDAIDALLEGESRPDVARWVEANLSDKARERRASLGARASVRPDVSAENRPRSHAPPPAVPDLPSPGQSGDGAPGFMDVNALLAKARAEPAAPEPPADVEHAGARRGANTPPKKTARKTSSLGPAGALKLGVLTIGVVILALGVLLLLPSVVRDRAIANAREAGFEITIERVGVGLGGVSLRGVEATVPRAPGITARIQEVYLAGLTGKEARVLGLDLHLKGRRSDLENAITSLIADDRARFAGTPTSPHHVSVVSARLDWEGTDGNRLLASDVGVELDSRGAGVEEVRGSVGRFEVRSASTTFGPWSSAFERNAINSRLRLMFDPPVPDGPSALVVWAKALPTQVTVKIPRSTFRNLGIKPADLGIPAEDATEVQVLIAGTLSETTRSEFTVDAALWGIRPKGFSGPVDVRLEGGGTSIGGKPFALEKTTLTLGSFVANVTGTITPHDERDLRLDAAFKTVPVPCERLARSEAKTMGPLAATLQALGQATKALRVTGTVNASGVVKYDTAAPGEVGLTWVAKETCGVSIFGM